MLISYDFIENNSLINIYYWGSPTSYSVIKKIGIIPATDRFGGFILNACYIVYINAVGKKRIKFFYVTGKNGFLIEELKNRELDIFEEKGNRVA